MLGVRSGGGVVFFLVRRSRKNVEEEFVTLMSCCLSIIFFRPLEVWRGRGDRGGRRRERERVVRRLSGGGLSSGGVGRDVIQNAEGVNGMV